MSDRGLDLSTWEGRMAAAAAGRRLVAEAENMLLREAQGDDGGEVEMGTATIVVGDRTIAKKGSYCLDLSGSPSADGDA